MSSGHNERQPLLHNVERQFNSDVDHSKRKVDFDEHDAADPLQWPLWRKYTIVAQITSIAFFAPMASSLFAPAMESIAEEFAAPKQLVLLNQTAFVCMLGIGPLFLAPMSETFGRRTIYMINLVIFTLCQIPVALAPNLPTFIVFRALSGLFGSVGVGNGGGSISDMFAKDRRAKVLGVYMVAPLLAPTIGPLISGLMVDRVNWRWLAWLEFALAALTTILCYFFLHETRAVTILQQRQRKLQKASPETDFYVEGVSKQSIAAKIAGNSTRALKILTTQPIVLIMSIYQALIFSTMYSLYAQYTQIWTQPPYEFDTTEVGLAYIGPALGFSLTSIVIILCIDKLYDWVATKNGDQGQPEYRLPFANIGAVLLPISLFWFGWSVERNAHWMVCLIAMLLFGSAQVSIFNPVQTYYIEAYESSAASALAAGAFLRSQVGGVVPLFIGQMFDSLGYGWGMSVFGFIAVVLMPAPLLFYRTGRRLRERYPFKG